LTNWVRTSSLDAPCASTFRQEALLGAPHGPAARSRMLRTVRLRDTVRCTTAEHRFDSVVVRRQVTAAASQRTRRSWTRPCPIAKHGGSERASRAPSQRRPSWVARAASGDGAPRGGARVPARASGIGTRVRASPADGAGGSRAQRAPQPGATDRSHGANGAAEAPDRAGANLADPERLSPASKMVPRFFSPGSR